MSRLPAPENPIPDMEPDADYKQTNEVAQPDNIAPLDDREPVVTRKELWSYYRASCSVSRSIKASHHLVAKSTIMVTVA
jgi:hypothetical protein